MRATYSPSKPIAIRVDPEKTMFKQTRDVQPGTVAFQTKAANMLKIPTPIPQTVTSNPAAMLSRRGRAENEDMAVQANRSIFQIEYFVEPALLGARRYGKITSRRP